MTRSWFAGKKIVVLGLGLHGGGLAVTKWLVKNKAQVTVTDIKTAAELAPSLKQLRGLPLKLVLGRHPLNLLAGCKMVVQNPAVPADHPFLKVARQRGVPIENEASLFLKLCPSSRLVAVTGTRGKSTTVSWLGEMLRRSWPRAIVAGNIRDTLLFEVLDRLTVSTPVALELSSWQLEVVGQHHLRIPVAVVTNVLPDHLNRYPSMADYARAKAMIFAGQEATDAVILNYDNDITKKMSRSALARVYWFSAEHVVPRGCFFKKGSIYWREGRGKNQFLYRQTDIKIPGRHNLLNCLAATCAALVMGVKPKQVYEAVRRFSGLHDRLELVRKLKGVAYYNDTTATSPHATLAALAAFSTEPIILIAGGSDKNLPYKQMAQAIKRRVQAVILLPGTATVKLQRELGLYKNQFLVANMNEAVSLAKSLAAVGSVVLLSPGAASFGLFQHEFDRGQAFKRAVKSLN